MHEHRGKSFHCGMLATPCIAFMQNILRYIIRYIHSPA